jgi:hypothetical protein
VVGTWQAQLMTVAVCSIAKIGASLTRITNCRNAVDSAIAANRQLKRLTEHTVFVDILDFFSKRLMFKLFLFKMI